MKTFQFWQYGAGAPSFPSNFTLFKTRTHLLSHAIMFRKYKFVELHYNDLEKKLYDD